MRFYINLQNNIKYKVFGLFILASFACPQPLFAYKVEGKVNYSKTEGQKTPLEFASVAWMEGKTAGMTQADGSFMMEGIRGKATLIASYVGYTKDTSVVSGGKAFEFNLFDEEKSLNSVTVTGRVSG